MPTEKMANKHSVRKQSSGGLEAMSRRRTVKLFLYDFADESGSSFWLWRQGSERCGWRYAVGVCHSDTG